MCACGVIRSLILPYPLPISNIPYFIPYYLIFVLTFSLPPLIFNLSFLISFFPRWLCLAPFKTEPHEANIRDILEANPPHLAEPFAVHYPGTIGPISAGARYFCHSPARHAATTNQTVSFSFPSSSSGCFFKIDEHRSGRAGVRRVSRLEHDLQFS